MINIMYLVLTAILALNVSAEVINAFRTVDHSLTTSNENITKANATIYTSLSEKLNDPQSAEKAKKWAPLADQAHKASDELITYIDALKKELKEGSGLRMVEKDGKMEEDYKLDGLDASTRIFETNGKGKEFEAKLVAYKAAILGLDPDIKKAFETTLPIDVTPPPSQEGHAKDFTASYFHMTPTIAALTMLSKFQNNVKNAENQVVTYCHNQIGAVKLIFNKFEPIAASSSTYLMPGQEMTVTAGVGAFNDAAKPVITIGGTPTALNDKGVAEKKFNVSGTGNQKVHVSIAYTKPDGTTDHLEKDIEYTVGVPGGAAVMLDKMNVFYIGVDNPVTISSGSGWDKTTVTPSGCTISGSGSNRTVKVSAVGMASITVSADGKTSKFDFRCKRIPDPIFKVGSGKVRMPSVEFKTQSYCRAELENFDFEAKYSITGATVYFSGANFPSPVGPLALTSNSIEGLRQYITRCGPGSVVTFENIKVVGPDGSRVIEGKSIALY
ncbi:gliding motility protein GldM [Ferruginibacter profundus]